MRDFFESTALLLKRAEQALRSKFVQSCSPRGSGLKMPVSFGSFFASVRYFLLVLRRLYTILQYMYFVVLLIKDLLDEEMKKTLHVSGPDLTSALGNKHN